MGTIQVQEDTAGNKYYSESDGQSTGSVRNWMEDKEGNLIWEWDHRNGRLISYPRREIRGAMKDMVMLDDYAWGS